MNWQTIAVTLSGLLAVVIVAGRMASVLRSNRTGACGSCDSCGAAKAGLTQTPLVQLGKKSP